MTIPSALRLLEDVSKDAECDERRSRNSDQMLVDLATLGEDLVRDIRAQPGAERTETLCEGWTVRDVVLHLVVGDDLTTRALHGENCFEKTTSDETYLEGLGRANVSAVGDLTLSESLQLFTESRARLLEVARTFSPADLGVKVPWAAGSIARFSALQARVMETWIHAWDIRHPLDIAHPLDDRAWWVNDLGVRTFPYALHKNAKELDQSRLRVELQGVGGGTWDRVITRSDSESTVSVTCPTWAWLTLVSRRHLRSLIGTGDIETSPPQSRDIVLEVARAFA